MNFVSSVSLQEDEGKETFLFDIIMSRSVQVYIKVYINQSLFIDRTLTV